MQAFTAARETPEMTTRPKVESGGGRSLLLTENVRSIGGPPSLFETLTPAEREIVVRCGGEAGDT